MKYEYKLIWEAEQEDPKDITSVLRWKWYVSKFSAYLNFEKLRGNRTAELWSRESGKWVSIPLKSKDDGNAK